MTERDPPVTGSWLQRRGVDLAVWCLVIAGVVAAAAAIAWLPSQVRVDLRAPELPSWRAQEPLIPVVVEPPPGAPPSEPPFATADTVLPSGEVVSNPRWLTQPAAEFPAEAMRRGYQEGAVDLACTVAVSGRLSDCRVVEETPEGHGFGASALKAASRARLEPRRVDGVAMEAQVRFSVHYRLA